MSVPMCSDAHAKWFVYRLTSLFRSVGHRVQTHKVTPAVGNERGEIEIDKYIVLPRGQDNHLPPRSLLVDFTMTHDRFGRSNFHTNGIRKKIHGLWDSAFG
jgi:hypothetical protein